MYRDNERDLTDRITFSVKRGFLEINRRLLERGTLRNQEDYFFLSREELYSLFQGHADPAITQAKIAGRSLDFHRFLNREFIPPMYISGGGTVSFESDNQALGDGHWRGTGTSSGTVSGTARVIRSLKDIGRVAKGEILITNSTDPGWTPVFMLIKGIVLETGDMLAHGSCLAREYGLPAIQLENAMELIPDGCEITITGDTGDVLVNLADGTVRGNSD